MHVIPDYDGIVRMIDKTNSSELIYPKKDTDTDTPAYDCVLTEFKDLILCTILLWKKCKTNNRGQIQSD